MFQLVKKLYSNLDLVVVVPHELAHFLAGRLIGVGVILALTSVAVPKDIPVWKHLVILIAPTVVGATVLVCSVSVPLLYGLTRSTIHIALWGSGFGIVFLASCLGDWSDLVRYWKSGEIV